MIAHIWKLSLLIISVCFIVINGTPITTTTSTERRDLKKSCKDANVMINSYPIRKKLVKYFSALNNSDLLSAHSTYKPLSTFASEVLNQRIKPLIIKNGMINSTIDKQIISTYEQKSNCQSYYLGNFSTLGERLTRTVLVFDECNNPTPRENLPFSPRCLQVVPYDNRLEISHDSASYGELGNNHPRSAVIIPRMLNASVDIQFHLDGQLIDGREWRRNTHEKKLILIFRQGARLPFDTEWIINEITSSADNRFLSICYALHAGRGPWGTIGRCASFVMFGGDNVETSTFLVETTDEEKLREKLVKWKSELDFLESHYIISFYFTKVSKEPTNGEEIFREIFGIQPTILRLPESELTETGLIYWNSTTTRATTNPGSVYAIVGFKKF